VLLVVASPSHVNPTTTESSCSPSLNTALKSVNTHQATMTMQHQASALDVPNGMPEDAGITDRNSPMC